MNGLYSKCSFGRWLFVSMGKRSPVPNGVKAWGLGPMREGLVEEKVSSQASGHRRKLEHSFRKVKLISSTVKPVILEHGNVRSQGRLVKDA